MKKIVTLALLSALTMTLQAKSTDLELAYQKEFTFLKAQKRSLQKRLTELTKHNNDKLKATQKKIDTLQATLLRLNTTSDKLSQHLLQAEREEQDVSDNSSVLEGTMMQSATTLKAFGHKVKTDSKRPVSELEKAFSFAAKQITKLASVQKINGSFFLLDGTKVDGEIIKVGNIASYGYTKDVATALVPAGNGLFKAWDNPAKDSATAIYEGKAKDTLSLFVYESTDKEIDSTVTKSAIDVINSGGAIGWVIVVLGLAALALMLLRVGFLRNADSNTTEIRAKVVGELLEKDEKSALKVCKASKGATARVLAATIRNIDKEREHLEDIVAEAVLHESSFLDRFGTAIMVIAAVAPLLGLLGTVTGMISTFDIITEFGTGDPKMLSGGISEALVTTELGLIVAIPALLVGNLLSGWSEKIKDHMEQAALHVNNVYLSNKNA